MSRTNAPEDGLLQEMLGDFLDEADEILCSLNENLLKLDECVQALAEDQSGGCDKELLNEMFRGAHSLKGLSGMLGFGNINALTHRVEHIFDAARHHELEMTSDVVEIVFQSVDHLSSMVNSLRDPSVEAPECESMLDRINDFLDATKSAERVSSSSVVTPDVLESSTDLPVSFAAQKPSEFVPDVAAEPPVETTTPSESVAATGVAEPVSDSPVEDPFATLEDEVEISEKYLGLFIDESEEVLDSVAAVLTSSDEKSPEFLMIQCHKVKGSAATVGLRRIAKLAHCMEDVLQEKLERREMLSDELAAAMLSCTDALRGCIDLLRSGKRQTPDLYPAYVAIMAADSGESSASTPPSKSHVQHPVSSLDSAREKIRASAPNDVPSWLVAVKFLPDLPLPSLKAAMVRNRLSEIGNLFFCEPSEAELDESTDVSQITLGVCGDLEETQLRKELLMGGVATTVVESVCSLDFDASEPPAVEAVSPNNSSTEPSGAPQVQSSGAVPGSGDGDKTPNKPTETLRVDIDRLDHLMNLAGQLVINKARFSQIGEGLKGLTASKQVSQAAANLSGTVERLSHDLGESGTASNKRIDLDHMRSQVRRLQIDVNAIRGDIQRFTQARSQVLDLVETIHQLDRVAAGIQNTVMETRMVPIGPLFRRFKRVIRDLTKHNDKAIQLVINGENTELDKRMIDELGDPLIHMVRNSADHGIETPAERIAAGKSEQGTILLDACHRGNSILIKIRDDGKGLDPAMIRKKAIENGILSQADADKMTDHQLLQLIWEPGFSTADKVTEVSGRGMGMDIVRAKIEEINGSIELDSTLGKGATFTIKLPLTLAILPSLLVEIDGDVIAMPVESVAEIVPLRPEDVATVHGHPTATVRGSVISIVSLSELFTWNQPARPDLAVESDDQSLVILGSNDNAIGLVVDRLLGEEDIVIKSLAENYSNVYGVAGASILGDGRVSLILDVGAILEMSESTPAETTRS